MRFPKINRSLKIYGGSYVVCIIAFATIYSFMTGQFYAPYTRLERSSRNDAHQVAEILQTAIFKTMAVEHGEALNANQLFAPSFSRVYGLRATDDWQLKFAIDFSFRGPFGISTVGTTASTRLVTSDPESIFVRIARNVGEVLSSDPQPQVITVYDHFIELDPSNVPSVSKFLGLPSDYIAHNVFHIELNPAQERVITNYANGVAGDPVLLSNAWERMFYFSAVVITTVGFGDIVPLTDTARLMVALEAIFGIVILGLFINSIASGNTHNSDPTKPTQKIGK